MLEFYIPLKNFNPRCQIENWWLQCPIRSDYRVPACKVVGALLYHQSQ